MVWPLASNWLPLKAICCSSGPTRPGGLSEPNLRLPGHTYRILLEEVTDGL